MNLASAKTSCLSKILLLLLVPFLVWPLIICLKLPLNFKPVSTLYECALLIFIMPILEESVFRGLLQDFLQQYLPKKWALIIAVNIFFVAVHFHLNNNPYYLGGVAVSGIIFSYVKLVTHKLSRAIFMHSYYNITYIIFTYAHAPVPAFFN